MKTVLLLPRPGAIKLYQQGPILTVYLLFSAGNSIYKFQPSVECDKLDIHKSLLYLACLELQPKTILKINKLDFVRKGNFFTLT